MSTPKYLYLTTIPNQEAELVNAECIALTGHAPNSHGIAISDRCVDVRRGGYVKSGMEVLFEAGSVSEICAAIQTAELYAEDFRVSVVKRPRNLKADSMKVAHTVGGVIGGNARLTQPHTLFLAVITNERIWLGRVLSESDGRWGPPSKAAAHHIKFPANTACTGDRQSHCLPDGWACRSVLRHRDNCVGGGTYGVGCCRV